MANFDIFFQNTDNQNSCSSSLHPSTKDENRSHFLNKNNSLQQKTLISEAKIAEIKEKVDFLNLVEYYTPLKKAGKELKGLCPFHKETTASFFINPEKKTYKCFGCDAGGDSIDFLMEAEKIDFPTAITRLANEANVSLDGLNTSYNPVYYRKKAIAPKIKRTEEIELTAIEPSSIQPKITISTERKRVTGDKKYSKGQIEIDSVEVRVIHHIHDASDQTKVIKEKKEYLDSQNERICKEISTLAILTNGTIEKTLDNIDKTSILPYAYSQLVDNLKGNYLINCEGQTAAQALIDKGIAATTGLNGYLTKENIKDLVACGVKGIIDITDNDSKGETNGLKNERLCLDANLPYLPIPIKNFYPLDYEVPAGADIKDFIKYWEMSNEKTMPKELLIELLLKGLPASYVIEQIEVSTDNLLPIEESSVNWQRIVSSPDAYTESYSDYCQIVSDILSKEDFDEKQIPFLASKLSRQFGIDRQVAKQDLISQWNLIKEVDAEEQKEIDDLLERQKEELNLYEILPKEFADGFYQAGNIQNVDPLGYLQYLLAAVATMTGFRRSLDLESHTIIMSLYLMIVGTTGLGKSRFYSVIFDDILSRQKRAFDKWKIDVDNYAERCKDAQKNNEQKPPKPSQQKYIISNATITKTQDILASQQDKNGTVLVKDELAGLLQQFKSLQKDSDCEAILNELWNGGAITIDRMDDEKSKYIEGTRFSMVGGIQPGLISRLLEDREDLSGKGARWLPVVLKELPKKRIKGHCWISDLLPSLYNYLENLPTATIRLSDESEAFYCKILDCINELKNPTLAIKAWTNKMDTHLMRLALPLHMLECFSDSNKDELTLEVSTLQKAWKLTQFYRNQLFVIQHISEDSTENNSIAAKILTYAEKFPDGVSLRDLSRNITPIQKLAKTTKRTAPEVTLELIEELVKAGRGDLLTKGKSRIFVLKTQSITEKRKVENSLPILPIDENPSDISITTVSNSIDNPLPINELAVKSTENLKSVSEKNIKNPLSEESSNSLLLTKRKRDIDLLHKLGKGSILYYQNKPSGFDTLERISVPDKTFTVVNSVNKDKRTISFDDLGSDRDYQIF